MMNNCREDFPLLRGLSEAYLDNAATSQKPQSVIDAERSFYETLNSNPMRGFYDLSIRSTDAYENAREAVRRFIGAKSTREIIFTGNATSSINLVAYSYGLANIKAGDRIVVTVAEHHSNMLPWQMVAEKTGAELVYMMCNDRGEFTDEEISRVITSGTKLVAVGIVSNVTGSRAPVEKIVSAAHSVGAVVMLDGAQSVPHTKTDVCALDADFLAFSAHKMLAPMGVGVLYGKEELLEKMPPFLRGGEMIESVTLDGAVFAELPHKFEAGTVNAAGAAGLAAAIEYYEKHGIENMEQREKYLTEYAYSRLSAIPHVNIIGSLDPANHSGILSFTVDGVHPHDVSAVLNDDGICIRAGHHCAQPLLKHLGMRSSSRASLMFYNTEEEIDRFIKSAASIRKLMGYRE